MTPPAHECDFTGDWESDATHHWHECSCGATDTKVAHSGGTATETEKAVCSECGTSYGELLPPDEDPEDTIPVVSIGSFNANFDTYAANGTVVQLSGMVYAGDKYGLYVIDEDQNTLYLKMDHSSLDISVGQRITVTGTANLYYSLPQLMVSTGYVGEMLNYSINLYAGTVAQIVSANSAQSAKVFTHNLYRATGVVTQEGSYYYLVDGDSKLQFKTATYADDLNNVISYVGQKISINIVLSDCFTTTGIFRISPMAGTDADIEVITDSSGGSSEATTTDINFIMINDTHGAFTDSSAGYSIGRVDSLVDALEKSKGDYIFIHNGDAFQGSYVCGETYGLAMIEALNASNLDCFVIGNHEFDWGIDKIAAYADGNLSNGEANFPFLGANIYYKGTTTRPDWIDAYAIVEQDGIKVGIIGVIGATHESSILTRYVKDYEFVNPLSIIQTTAAYLRNTAGCDVVVVATHEYDTTLNTSIAGLSGSSRIDAIFCAHTHELITESVTRSDSVQIPVVQCNHKNNNAQEVIVTISSDKEYVSYTTNLHYLSGYSISTDVQAVITKYQSLIDKSNEVIGKTNSTIYKSTLGAYAVEAMVEYAYTDYDFGDVDVAIINTGGVRATINVGDITRAEIFEVFPFNNAIVLVNISGALIKDLYSKNSTYLYIDVDDSIGSYTSLNDSTIYQLAVIDYVFEGTYYTQFNGLSENDYIVTDYLMRELLMAYIEEAY